MEKISALLMAAFYIGISFTHFLRPKFFLQLLPEWLPLPKLLNYVSGGVELLLGVLLLFPSYRILASWGVVALLMASLPIKIHIYRHPDKETPELMKWYYQVLLIGWALYHAEVLRF